MIIKFRAFLVRDIFIVVLTGALWLLNIDATLWHIATGSLTGLCALLFHEWGHLVGARRSGATVHPAPNIFLPFLFDLDSQANSSRQFVVTSLAGFAATAVFLIVFTLLLPLEMLAGQVAMGIALLLATLTVVIEFPIAWRVYKGYAIPRVEIYRRPR